MEEKSVIHLGRPLQKSDIGALIPKSQIKDSGVDLQYGSSFKSQYEKRWKIKG